MIHTIAFTLFLGKPLVLYGGLLTFLLLIFTAVVGALNFKGIVVIPFKWHPRLAIITIIVAVIHGLFGLSIWFNFGMIMGYGRNITPYYLPHAKYHLAEFVDRHLVSFMDHSLEGGGFMALGAQRARRVVHCVFDHKYPRDFGNPLPVHFQSEKKTQDSGEAARGDFGFAAILWSGRYKQERSAKSREKNNVNKRSKIKAENREKKKKVTMVVSGKSVFKIKEIIVKKARSINKKTS